MIRSFFFLGIAVVLFFVWLISFIAFHVASGLIHLLLVVAMIALLLHFFVGRRSSD